MLSALQSRAHPPRLPRGSLTDFDTVTAAILVVLALSPQGTLEILALDGPSNADTVLGTAAGDPVLAFLQKPGAERHSDGEDCFWGDSPPVEGLVLSVH